jgi:2-dehydropantoate 2-reductase
MDVFQDPDVQALARALLQEGVLVAQADGALLGPHDIQSVLERYLAFGSEGGTSMLYDRLAARTLEYEALTGAVVERARKYGVAAPLHHVLLTLLRVAAPCDAVKT